MEAVEAGAFAVYGVDDIDQALELLTGVAAREPGVDGLYPPDSVYGKAAARLEEMAHVVAEWGEGEDEKVQS